MKLRNLVNSIGADDRAVSPVIGVILMVAITVILAAVIGTFVLGLGDSVESEVQAGVTINGTDASETRTVTWTSQGTADNINVTDGTSSNSVDIDNVGGSATVTTGSDEDINDLSTGSQLSVIAETDDGKQTVIQTFQVSN